MRKVFVSFLILFSVLFMSCGALSTKYLSENVYDEKKSDYFIYACYSDPFKRFSLTHAEWNKLLPSTRSAFFSAASSAGYSVLQFQSYTALCSVAYNAGYKYAAIVSNKGSVSPSSYTLISSGSFATVSTSNLYNVSGDAVLFYNQEQVQNIRERFNIIQILYVDDYALQLKEKK